MTDQFSIPPQADSTQIREYFLAVSDLGNAKVHLDDTPPALSAYMVCPPVVVGGDGAERVITVGGEEKMTRDAENVRKAAADQTADWEGLLAKFLKQKYRTSTTYELLHELDSMSLLRQPPTPYTEHLPNPPIITSPETLSTSALLASLTNTTLPPLIDVGPSWMDAVYKSTAVLSLSDVKQFILPRLIDGEIRGDTVKTVADSVMKRVRVDDFTDQDVEKLLTVPGGVELGLYIMNSRVATVATETAWGNLLLNTLTSHPESTISIFNQAVRLSRGDLTQPLSEWGTALVSLMSAASTAPAVLSASSKALVHVASSGQLHNVEKLLSTLHELYPEDRRDDTDLTNHHRHALAGLLEALGYCEMRREIQPYLTAIWKTLVDHSCVYTPYVRAVLLPYDDGGIDVGLKQDEVAVGAAFIIQRLGPETPCLIPAALRLLKECPVELEEPLVRCIVCCVERLSGKGVDEGKKKKKKKKKKVEGEVTWKPASFDEKTAESIVVSGISLLPKGKKINLCSDVDDVQLYLSVVCGGGPQCLLEVIAAACHHGQQGVLYDAIQTTQLPIIAAFSTQAASDILWGYFFHHSCNPLTLPPDYDPAPLVDTEYKGHALLPLSACHPSAHTLIPTLLPHAPTKLLMLFHHYLKQTNTLPPTLLIQQCINYTLAADVHPHTITAFDILHHVLCLTPEASSDALWEPLRAKYVQVFTGIGRYGQCKLPPYVDSVSYVRSVIVSVVSKVVAGGEVKVSYDPKFLKKVVSLVVTDEEPTIALMHCLTLRTTAAKDLLKLTDIFLPTLIPLWCATTTPTTASLILEIVLHTTTTKHGLKSLLLNFPDARDKLREAPSILPAVKQLLDNLEAEEALEEAARLEREEKEREMMRVQLEEEEKERLERERRRAVEEEIQRKRDAETARREAEIKRKIEAERKAAEKEEKRKRALEAERVRQAQKEEQELKEKEEESRRVRDKDRAERDRAMKLETQTLSALKGIGVPVLKAKRAMRACGGHDMDVLVEWLVGSEDAQGEDAPRTADGVEAVMVTGQGAIKVIPTQGQELPSTTPSLSVSDLIRAATADTDDTPAADDGDDYQDFWTVDVDLSKNLTDFSPEDLEEEGPDHDEAEQRVLQDTGVDYKKMFDAKLEEMERCHPSYDARKGLPAWHTKLAPLLDLFDYDKNTRCRLYDLKVFLKKDLGIKWEKHLGYGSLRDYVAAGEEKGLIKKSGEVGYEFVVLTRFGRRYHQQFWHRSTSVVTRRPVEDALRRERKAARGRVEAEARKRALDALLTMKMSDLGMDEREEGDELELDPASLVLPDWWLDEEADEAEADTKLTAEEIDALQAQRLEKRMDRLRKLVKDGTTTGRHVVKSKRKKISDGKPSAPTKTAAEIAEEQRLQAKERLVKRKEAENNAVARTKTAERASKRAAAKRLQEQQPFLTPEQKLMLFCFSCIAFMAYMTFVP